MWKLISRAFILLLFLSLILLLTFSGIAWSNDTLQFPRFLELPAQGGTPTTLVINVYPSDATIMLNDQPFNPKDILIPGDYLVRISDENFFPVEETIRVHPNEQNQLYIRLMPIVAVQELSRYAVYPGWDDQNNLYYLDFSKGKIYSGVDKAPLDIVSISNVGVIHELIYLLNGTQAVAIASQGPESSSKLFLVNFQTAGETTELPVMGLVSGGQDDVIWGINNLDADRQKPFWKLTPGGDPQFYPLENQEWAIYVEQLLVDPTEQWLAIESPMGIGVWEIASGELVTTFENSSAPVWVQNPQSGLAYLSANQTLIFARTDRNWSSVDLLSNIQRPIASLPGSSEIVFTRYNPFEGGTSFWAVDTVTSGVRLLSEAKTESGKVEQFAISPDGKKIAFVNERNILYLVVLEP